MYKFYTVLSLSLQKSLTLLHYLQNRVWLSERVIMRIRWNNQVVPCIVLMVWIDWSLYLSLQTRIHCRIHRKVSLEMATDLKNRFHTNAIPKEDLWGIFIIKVVQTFHFINTLFNLVNAAFTSPEGTLSPAKFLFKKKITSWRFFKSTLKTNPLGELHQEQQPLDLQIQAKIFTRCRNYLETMQWWWDCGRRQGNKRGRGGQAGRERAKRKTEGFPSPCKFRSFSISGHLLFKTKISTLRLEIDERQSDTTDVTLENADPLGWFFHNVLFKDANVICFKRGKEQHLSKSHFPSYSFYSIN